ncbi:MAG: cell division protein SepF, partial [Micrococcales bacterium]|nr:cell division protein SepF [Micrococcales bacterium]
MTAIDVWELAMAGALRKTMEYLGLTEVDPRHDRYDGYDGYEEPEQADDGGEHTAAVTALPTSRRPVAAVVRDAEVGPLNRITTIHPRTYNEAKNIGEWFRDQVPV